MKWESLIPQFHKNDFINIDNQSLEYKNIRVWKDNRRIIFVKEYRTELNFLKWEDDQLAIQNQIINIENKYKNNIYFFLVINFNSLKENVLLEINRAKKNEYVCKKHILIESKDVERIPFLTSFKVNNTNINLDYYFKEKITNNINMGDKINIEKITEYYFNNYIETNEVSNILKEIIGEDL